MWKHFRLRVGILRARSFRKIANTPVIVPGGLTFEAEFSQHESIELPNSPTPQLPNSPTPQLPNSCNS
jgi:hypothetical protein